MSSLIPELIDDCVSCGRPLSAGSLVCDRCHALVYAKELDALSAKARDLESKHELSAAKETWKQMLSKLPSESNQAAWIYDRILSLEKTLSVPPPPENSWVRKAGPLAPLAIFLAKSKGLLLAIFKLKFLLSLFSFVAVYWALYGWKFGVGFAAAILIHEMGHFIDIKRRGWPAEMPVFLPGLGAYVRWQALGVTLKQRAQVSLAGPLAGWIAAAICTLLYFQTGNALWASLGRAGAALNVLNLIPVWVLDGGQAANALDRNDRLWLLGATLVLWLLTREGLFFLVGAGTLWRLFTKDKPVESSRNILFYYIAVLAALAITLHELPGAGFGR